MDPRQRRAARGPRKGRRGPDDLGHFGYGLGHDCGPLRGQGHFEGRFSPEQLRHFGLRRYVRAKLHRRLFVSMGLAIFVSLAVSIVIAIWLGKPQQNFELERIERLAGQQFAVVWDDPVERARLAEHAAEAFGVALSLRDARGVSVFETSKACRRPEFSVAVYDDPGPKLGDVFVCMGKHRGWHAPWLIAPIVFGFVLWIFSGFVAHRLGRPLGRLVEVTREIGVGKLSSRTRLGRHEAGELGVLAESINDMATRLEKQLDDQKELLAAVSHEMRTPLSRLRVLAELLEAQGTSAKLSADMQREIIELDDLIGQLLANSRLEFNALRSARHDPVEIARVALGRLGLSTDILEVDPRLIESPALIQGDATLLTRALLNLLNNAQTHGAVARKLKVGMKEEGTIEFSVEDGGPGFQSADLSRAFDSFYRGEHREPGHRAPPTGKGGGALGLGLSLVKRIARAHHGDARAENLPDGARVSFWVRDDPAFAIT